MQLKYEILAYLYSQRMVLGPDLQTLHGKVYFHQVQHFIQADGYFRYTVKHFILFMIFCGVMLIYTGKSGDPWCPIITSFCKYPSTSSG